MIGLFNKFNSGDLVYRAFNAKQKYGIVVFSKQSNRYPSKNAENVLNSYPWHHYVLFDDLIEGPFLSDELSKVN